MATKPNETNEAVTADQDVETTLLDVQSAAVKRLIAKGKERGYLTFDELNAVLPSDQNSSEQIEDVMANLSEMGIQVVESEEGEDSEAPAPKAEPDRAAGHGAVRALGHDLPIELHLHLVAADRDRGATPSRVLRGRKLYPALLRPAEVETELADGGRVPFFRLRHGATVRNEDEVREFLDCIEAGVVYVNRQASATTGAMVGCQPFGGWKGSGTTGRGTGGPHYLSQFMREQSQTIAG